MDKIFEKYRRQVDEVIEVCHRDGELGYGPSVSGNVAYRTDDDFVIVTPTNVPKRKMRPEYLCAVHLDGTIIYTPEGMKPTGELFMHLHCLRKRPDIKAVMHAHPPISTGLSACRGGREALMLPLIPEAMMQLGPIITVPYANPNMEELGYMIDPYMNKSNAFMLESHGVLVLSPNGVLEVIESIQLLDSMAESIVAAKTMGDELAYLTYEDLDGIDETIQALGWRLPGAPGEYKSMKEIFSQEVPK